jgi:hypothetical protein
LIAIESLNITNSPIRKYNLAVCTNDNEKKQAKAKASQRTRLILALTVFCDGLLRMMPAGRERILIFGSFIGIGIFVVGVVGYRSMTAPSSRIFPVTLLEARQSSDIKGKEITPTAPSAIIPEAAANTDAVAPATLPIPIKPVTAVKREPEPAMIAMLPPAQPRRGRQSKSAKQSGVKPAQLDVCAKIGKKRVYYMKGNGKYWRCR